MTGRMYNPMVVDERRCIERLQAARNSAAPASPQAHLTSLSSLFHHFSLLPVRDSYKLGDLSLLSC